MSYWYGCARNSRVLGWASQRFAGRDLSSAWSSLPLNTKLIASLVAVQAVVLLIGTLSLNHWIRDTRLDSLAVHLDTQADLLEDMISVNSNGKVTIALNEVGRELSLDPDFFYALFGADDQVISASQATPAGIRQRLQRRIERAKFHGVSAVQDILVRRNEWKVQREVLERKGEDGVPHISTLYVAINAQPTIDGINQVGQMIIVGAVALMIVTSMGSGLVVSLSTRNLRVFADRLRQTHPLRMATATDLSLKPQSAVEKQLFESYQHMASNVQSTIDTQRLFIAKASHELKTPVSAGIAAIEVALSRPRSDDAYRETFRAVLAELQVHRRLSTALLDLARLEDQFVTSPRGSESCNLRVAMQRVLGRWQRLSEERGITLTLTNDLNRAFPDVQGTLEQWEIVIGNFVDNAIRYGRPQGRVDIEITLAPSGGLEIVIADDGPGVSADAMANLGGLFYRNLDRESGTMSVGLGIAHSQQIIDSLGGNIRIETTRGVGTNVRVTGLCPATSGAHAS